MNRSEALKIIRAAAKAKDRPVRVDTKAGKGSHAKVYVGRSRTVIPNKVSPFMLRKILGQLDLED
jgi:hypothetical protein